MLNTSKIEMSRNAFWEMHIYHFHRSGRSPNMRDFFSTAQIGKINKTYINKDLYLYNIDLVINNILQIYLHFEPSAKIPHSFFCTF